MSTDGQLRRDSGRFARIGVAFLLIALVVAIVGTVLLLIGGDKSSTAYGLGEMLDWLAVAPAAIGVALLVAAGVSRRTARRKPFA